MSLSLFRSRSHFLFFVICLTPFIYLVWAALSNNLGPDPAEALADASGEWALRMLFVTLAMAPLRKLTGRLAWLQYRRMLGLYSFFYALMHMLVYVFFLLGLQWRSLWGDILERPYITAGLVALLLMLPLAITSTRQWQRRLGRRWKNLHQLIFVVAIAALVHLWWQVRSDAAEAWLYTAVFIVLVMPRCYEPLRRLFKMKRKQLD
jgi:sulfoxide reductase heme-binding subunit YedZ